MGKQKVRACSHPLHQSERERGKERDKEIEIERGREYKVILESSSLTRNKFFNCPELLFLKVIRVPWHLLVI
jgi:hypothetical protein